MCVYIYMYIYISKYIYIYIYIYTYTHRDTHTYTYTFIKSNSQCGRNFSIRNKKKKNLNDKYFPPFQIEKASEKIERLYFPYFVYI